MQRDVRDVVIMKTSLMKQNEALWVSFPGLSKVSILLRFLIVWLSITQLCAPKLVQLIFWNYC